MTDIEWILLVGGAGSLVFGVLARKAIDAFARAIQIRCPDCNEKKILLDEREHVGGVDVSTHAQLFVCTACRAELARRDNGPLIPREAFRAGASEPLPVARVVDSKQPVRGPEA